MYNTFLREDLRIIITRWRLSCIPLKIETGRYEGLSRERRLCPFCDILEDENHAIFICDGYKELRNDNKELLEANASVKDLLNPKDKDTAYKLGCFLKQIEERRQSLVERHSG